MENAPFDMPIVEVLKALRDSLDNILNGEDVQTDESRRRNGFVLLLYPFGEHHGRCHFVSNGATHEEIIGMFKRQAEMFEKKPQ